MSTRIVLDAAAFDVLAQPGGTDLRSFLIRSAERGTDTFCAALATAVPGVRIVTRHL